MAPAATKLLAISLISAQWRARWALRSPVVENALNEFKELKAICNSLMGLSRYLG